MNVNAVLLAPNPSRLAGAALLPDFRLSGIALQNSAGSRHALCLHAVVNLCLPAPELEIWVSNFSTDHMPKFGVLLKLTLPLNFNPSSHTDTD